MRSKKHCVIEWRRNRRLLVHTGLSVCIKTVITRTLNVPGTDLVSYGRGGLIVRFRKSNVPKYRAPHWKRALRTAVSIDSATKGTNLPFYIVLFVTEASAIGVQNASKFVVLGLDFVKTSLYPVPSL